MKVSNAKGFLDNINRSVLLGIGLVVIAGLVAVAFVLGDTDQVADRSNNEATQQQEENQEAGVSGNEDTETAAGSEDAESTEEDANGQTTDEEGNNDQEATVNAAPSQLADTGPVSLSAALLLGAGGYFYHRSRNNLEESRKE